MFARSGINRARPGNMYQRPGIMRGLHHFVPRRPNFMCASPASIARPGISCAPRPGINCAEPRITGTFARLSSYTFVTRESVVHAQHETEVHS